MNFRTRFAPSPTGYLHIGSLRTAAYAYALAKHSGGQFLLRIEDTDQKRLVKDSVDKIYSILKTFGLNWDEDVIIQSQQAALGVYKSQALSLLNSGHAFYCQCIARDAKHQGYSQVLRDPCRDKNLTSGAIKIKIPDNEVISYHDYVQNKAISWKSDLVPDTTLLKSSDLGELPTYHLAAVVDDLSSKITHVLRGHDWQPSTPVHLYVYKFLGVDHPEIGHFTDILDPAGGKLSKRKGNVSVEQFLKDGYLPEALLNFVILLGWAPKDNRELYTLGEFVSAFDPSGFQKSNPILNLSKLDWFNGQYLRSKTDTEITQLVKPYMKNDISDTLLAQILPLVKDRLVKLADFQSLVSGFFSPPTEYADGINPDFLKAASQILSTVSWTKSDIESNLMSYIKSQDWKVGDFFMSLRIAIWGSRFTPPLTETMLVLGKNESIARIKTAMDLFK